MVKELSSQFYNKITSNLWSLLETNGDKVALFGLGEKEIKKRFNALKMSFKNHNEIVKQNQQLQSELRTLKERPFFPYELNSGNGLDFGEFILISHAWFTISNLPAQLGIVEVEWKSSGFREMYLGAGCSGGKDFKSDVLVIALHGQKIKDSSEV